MRLSDALLQHAFELSAPPEPTEVQRRRAVSAAYYALFHRLTEDAAALIAPNVSSEVRSRIQRWFEHAEMRTICGRFSKSDLSQPLRSLIGPAPSPELGAVASEFILLQDERHSADYDPLHPVSAFDAARLVMQSASAIQLWETIAATNEANVFLLSMLLWKRWDNGRP